MIHTIFFLSANSATRAKAASLLRFLDRTQLDTPGRITLNEWSARRRGRYLHNTQKHETNIYIVSGIRTRDSSNWAASHLVYALDHTATGIGWWSSTVACLLLGVELTF
jgi:hypothetical protein